MLRVLYLLLKLVLLGLGLAGVAGLAFFLALKYATSSDSVEVPDVIGLHLTEATRRLDAVGLRVLFEEEEKNVFDEKVPRDHVVRQEPPAGSRLKQNRRVRLVLSLGPRNLYVPRVVGEPLNAAQIRLQEAGLGVGGVVYVPSPLAPENVVLDQQPGQVGGGGVEEGGIRLLVSSGSPPVQYIMPDLIGRPVLRARAALELSNLRVRVESEVYEGVPEGSVIRQKPLAGYPIRGGDTAWLWASRAAIGGGRP